MSNKSHHSRHSRNLSVNSLPTITEEKNRALGSQAKAYCMCKRDDLASSGATYQSSGAEEESKDPQKRLCPRCHQQQRKNHHHHHHRGGKEVSSSGFDHRRRSRLIKDEQSKIEEGKGRVTEAGIADEEDSSLSSSSS